MVRVELLTSRMGMTPLSMLIVVTMIVMIASSTTESSCLLGCTGGEDMGAPCSSGIPAMRLGSPMCPPTSPGTTGRSGGGWPVCRQSTAAWGSRTWFKQITDPNSYPTQTQDGNLKSLQNIQISSEKHISRAWIHLEFVHAWWINKEDVYRVINNSCYFVDASESH